MEDAPKPQPTSHAASTLRAHAVLLGERLSRTGLDTGGAVTTAPLSFRVGESGLVVVFRYGVVVMLGLSDAEEASALAWLAERIIGAEEPLEEETAQIVVRGPNTRS